MNNELREWRHYKGCHSNLLTSVKLTLKLENQRDLLCSSYVYCRQILMEGPLSMVDSGKTVEMFMILFDDMLIITRRKKALSKKVCLRIYLDIFGRRNSFSFIRVQITFYITLRNVNCKEF